MIEYIEGDIFDSPAQVIVNTVNTVGVMGKGLALSFKQRYPEMFERYKMACEKHLLSVGKLMLFYETDHWLLLFPTKENWRYPSKMEFIEKGLMKFVQTYSEKSITSIAFPRLGCGNGELDWNDVKPLMEKYLKKLPIDVYIYLGVGSEIVPEHKDQSKTLKWLRENAKDLSFNGVRDDLIGLCAFLPYSFEIGELKFELTYNNEEFQISNNNFYKPCTIKEERLFEIWDEMRKRSVFSVSSSSEDEKLVYGLLFSAGYLSKIKLFNNKTNEMEEGYQINAGLGRVHAFKGV